MNFYNSNFSEIIKFFGILITAMVTVASLFVTIYHNRKTTYINQITTLKAKYIEALRENISNFCSLAFDCNKAWTLNNYKQDSRHITLTDMQRLQYLLTLYLDSKEEIDVVITNPVQEIVIAVSSKGENGINIGFTINKLLEYTQQVILYEWRNARKEAKRGPTKQSLKLKAKEDFIKAFVKENKGLSK